MTAFAAYEAHDVPTTRSTVEAVCQRAMFAGYGPDAPGLPRAALAFPMSMYEDLLAALTGGAHIDVVTLRDLCRVPACEGRLRLAIRHDVDGDIVAAADMARLEHAAGVPSSYYVLHTAPYHGSFRAGRFERHRGALHIYREMAALGHEIGLHTDALTVYQQHAMDGAAAIVAEIAWLREHGLDVRGTVAHGSKSVFGAENFEIFRGRRRSQARWDDPSQDEPRELDHAGTRAMLGVLDERELGLEYEGNDIFFQKDVPVAYGATRDADGWRWNPYLQRWRKDPTDLGPAFCTQEEMVRDILALPPGTCCVLTVHPCYYGLRASPDAPPMRRAGRTRLSIDDGWPAPPRHAVVQSAAAGAPRRVAAARVNRWGVADMPPARGAEPRILVTGTGNLDAPGIVVPSQVHKQLELRLRHGGLDRAAVAKLTSPTLGVARIADSLMRIARRWRPTLVLLGLDPREPCLSLAPLWAPAEGFSPGHPPGPYLDWQDGGLVSRRRSRRWIARQRTPRAATPPPSDIDDETRLDGIPVQAMLAACYRRVADQLRALGASAIIIAADTPVPWMEDVARRSGLPIVDPTRSFAEATAASVRDGEAWSPYGHRQAAAALHRAIVELGLLPEPRPRVVTGY